MVTNEIEAGPAQAGGTAGWGVPPVVARLAASRKFWIAVVAVGQSIVFALWPGFPQDVWQAIDGLAAVLIAAIAYEDGAWARGGKM